MIADRWLAVLCITVGSAVLALAISFFLQPRYTATVSFLVPKRNSSLGFTLTSQFSAPPELGALRSLSGQPARPQDLYIGMLESQAIEDAVVIRFDLMQEYHARRLSDARRALEQHVLLDGDGVGGLIIIDVDDREPGRAASIANTYVAELRTMLDRLAVTEAARRRIFYEKEMEQSKQRLEGAEQALMETERATAVIQPDSQARVLIEAAANLRGSIAAKEVQIQGMRTYATGDNAQLVAAREELKGLQSELDRLGGAAKSEGDLVLPRGRLTQAGLEYARRLREVKYYETLYEALAGQMEVASLDQAKQGSLIQVVDPALPPDRRSFPQRGSITLGALVAGLLGGISYAFCAAGLRHLLAQPEVRGKLLYIRHMLSGKTGTPTEDSVK